MLLMLLGRSDGDGRWVPEISWRMLPVGARSVRRERARTLRQLGSDLAWVRCADRGSVRYNKSSRTETRAESRVGGSNIATQARQLQSRLRCHQCYSMAPIRLSLQLHSGRFWVFDLEPNAANGPGGFSFELLRFPVVAQLFPNCSHRSD